MKPFTYERAQSPAQAAVRLGYVGERQARDVDEMLRRLGLDLHQVQKVGAAGQEPGAGTGDSL